LAEGNDNVDVIDVYSYFASKDKLFADGLHLTRKGDEYMAGIIAKRLTDTH